MRRMGNEQMNNEIGASTEFSIQQGDQLKLSPPKSMSPIDIHSKTICNYCNQNTNSKVSSTALTLSSTATTSRSYQKKDIDKTPSGYLSPITPVSPLHHSINKITKRIISDRVIELAANFWHKNIDFLSHEDRLVELFLADSKKSYNN